MALVVPLQPVPSQQALCSLGGQNTQVNCYQLSTGFFIDVLVDNKQIIGGVICENLHRIVQSAYLGFIGDFTFLDTRGENDPYYTGLGPNASARFQLIYLSASDLASGVVTAGD